MQRLPGCEAALVSLREGRNGPMVARTAHGMDADKVELLQLGELVEIPELRKKGILSLDSTKDRFKDKVTPFRSCLLVPILSRGHLVGCLLAVNWSKPGAFDYKELAEVEQCARTLAEDLEKEDWARPQHTPKEAPQTKSRLPRLLLAPGAFVAALGLYTVLVGGGPTFETPRDTSSGVRLQLEARLVRPEGQPIPANKIDRGRFVVTCGDSKVQLSSAQISTRGDGSLGLAAQIPKANRYQLFVHLPGFRPHTLDLSSPEQTVGDIVIEPQTRRLKSQS